MHLEIKKHQYRSGFFFFRKETAINGENRTSWRGKGIVGEWEQHGLV